MSDLLLRRTAIISECKKYRYRLMREWGNGKLLAFVMLNPSTANAEIDDPTIRRCMSFARRENASGIVVVNIFAFRAVSPKNLAKADNPYGPDNFEALGEILTDARIQGTVCAWGAHAIATSPGMVFVKRAKKAGVQTVCLGQTRNDSPKHPLYVKGDTAFHAYPTAFQVYP